MNDLILSDLDNFIEEFTRSDDFLRLKELKNIIDNKYFSLISNFKIALEDYDQALKNQKYINDLDKIKEKFSNAKSSLYEKIEVIEYKKLEKKLSDELAKLSNELSFEMSNKFKLTKIIE